MVVLGFGVGLLLTYVGYLIENIVLRNIGIVWAVMLAVPALVRLLRRSPPPRNTRSRFKGRRSVQWAIAIGFVLLIASPAVVKEFQTCGHLDLALGRSDCVFRVRQRLNPAEIAFSPDGSVLATVGVGQVNLREATTGQRTAILRDAHRAASISFSPDGLIAVGNRDGWLRLWSTDGDSLREWQVHNTETVRHVGVTPQGDRLVTLASTSEALIWTIDGEPIGRLAHNTPVDQLAVTHLDGIDRVATSSGGTVRLWQLIDGEVPIVVDPPSGAYAIAFHPDGSLLASADDGGSIHLWDTRTGNLLHTLGEATGGPIQALAFSGDGRRLAAGSSDRTVYLWDVEQRTLVREIKNHRGRVAGVAVSPNGHLIAVAVVLSGSEASGDRETVVQTAEMIVWENAA